jgi:lipopolysaccharide transport system ATP-binding protein
MLSDTWVFRLQGVGKRYRMYRRPHDRLKDLLAEILAPSAIRNGRGRFEEHCALQGINLTIRPGETLGIVGLNGSGKSTLLQIMAGILAPSEGVVERRGKIAALLELGAGFNPDFTGRENVYLNAALFGLSTAQTNQRIDAIFDFADIGDYIDQPVKTYSSGMVVRLAFAIVANVDADVLIIDEALAVGDVFFVQKCMSFLRRFMDRGTLVFVSHDTNLVLNLCNRAVLIADGRMIHEGDPKDVVELYLANLHGGQRTGSDKRSMEDGVTFVTRRDMRQDLVLASKYRNDLQIFEFDPDAESFGRLGAEIVDLALSNEVGEPYAWIVGGEMVRLVIRCRALEELANAIIGFHLKDRLGQAVFGDNTYLSTLSRSCRAEAGDDLRAEFLFRMPILPPGEYTISAAIADGTQEDHSHQHWIHDAIVVISHASSSFRGLVGIPMERIELAISSGHAGVKSSGSDQAGHVNA